MPLITIANTGTVDVGYLDCNNNPVTIPPGGSKKIEVNTHMPNEVTKLSIVTDEDGAGNINYIGYALANTDFGHAAWAIKKRFDLGNNDEVYRWVNGENPPKMKYVWNNRTTLIYV